MNNTYHIFEIPSDPYLPAESIIEGTTNWDADTTHEHFKNIFTAIGKTYQMDWNGEEKFKWQNYRVSNASYSMN